MTWDKDTLSKLVIAATVIFLAGFGLGLVVVDRPEPSAAVTIRRTLIVLLVAPLILGVAGVLLKQWWARRQKRQRYEDALLQARVYERLQGDTSKTRSQPRRRSSESKSGDDSTIQIVLSDRMSDRVRER
jgi:hypothetical protein